MRLQPEEIRIGLGGPAGTDEAEVGNQVAAGADERLGEAVFDRRQVERRAADARFVAAFVEDQRADLEGRRTR